MLENLNLLKNIENHDAFLLSLKQASIEQIYVKMLEAQVKYCASSVQNYMLKNDSWMAAKTVLDAGCGPGEFVFEHQSIFSNKKYLGIDISETFINLARKKFIIKKDQFHFEKRDLLEVFNGKFDVTLLWAVLQHVTSVGAALDNLSKYTDCFIVLDTRPGRYDFDSQPQLKLMSHFYEVIHEQSKKKGRNTDCLLEVEEWASQAGWSVQSREDFGPRAETREQKQVFQYYCCMLAESFSRHYSIDTDIRKLLLELEHWKTSPHSYATTKGAQWFCLTRK
jgi:SAM-dependent methyltransferase